MNVFIFIFCSPNAHSLSFSLSRALCLIQENSPKIRKKNILLNRFYLNGQTSGRHSQTLKVRTTLYRIVNNTVGNFLFNVRMSWEMFRPLQPHFILEIRA